ncbi:aspartate kinase [Clohesyomyces aquaticus]|uniref:Aspartokinase n=1 Tax=Clohesyomyces aquaticus TaxID=1231657 RepID=A0A1Y1ZYW1_9PLEO|nr:aspartate kinase [Clohesyomyces aquaticus]
MALSQNEVRSKPWVVQKYGGTSIGKLLSTITGSIIPQYLESYNVAVVCSARSGTSKSSGTTSHLLDAIKAATSNETDTNQLDDIIDLIKRDHLQAGQDAINDSVDKHILANLEQAIKKDCEWLRSFLKATWTLGEISGRTQDRVLAVGELLSCRIVAASLKSKSVGAYVVTLDDIVQDAYGKDHMTLLKAYRNEPSGFLGGLQHAIRSRLRTCGKGVPVITGFFGSMPDSLIHSVGRGYSDLCAALCAVALDADELQIWKEVDGVFTADPRKIKTARLLATITSEEAAELTYYGSEVIHPLTIEQIDTAGIPLRLKNVKDPLGAGTIIYPSSRRTSNRSSPERSSLDTAFYRRTPTAVTVKEKITVFNVRSHGTMRPQAFLARVGAIMETHDITIDLISSSQQMLSLAVCSAESHSFGNAAAELASLGTVNAVKDMCIVSVVGHKMRNMVGVAGEIFNALATARINIYLISQGASEINISFVVKARDALLAMEVVHTNVMRIPLHSEQENTFIKGPWLY